MSAVSAAVSVFRRDLLLNFRSRSEIFNPLIFLVLVITLFPLGIGPDSKILAIISGGAIWVGALLANMLSIDSIFRSDYDDGTLESYLTGQTPLPLIVLAKTAASWVSSGLPLVAISPLLGLLLNISDAAMPTLIFSLLLGTPTLSCIGSIAVALTLGLKRGGYLQSLMVLPLYVPILILSTGAIDYAASDLSPSGLLYLLAALLVAAITITPFASAWALKISQS